MRAPIAITQGDAAGIGPEIIVKAFATEPERLAGCFVAGDVATLRRAAAWVQTDGATLPVAPIDVPEQALQAPPRCLPVLQVGAQRPLAEPGRISAEAGRLAGDCVRWAAQAALHGTVAAIVTAPLHKKALSAAGAPYDDFPGHTELLQAEAARHLGLEPGQLPVRMMLANEELRTVLLSIHLSLRDAIEQVSESNILETLEIMHKHVSSRQQGRLPRIAVAGLNPHAGEDGLFGREEIEHIAPAIARARARGIDAHGPFAPDTVFMRARHTPERAGEFDAVLAMYHDQGLIPVKYLGVEQGVNVTLGLPFVRTSPDHGTAFDLAGTGRADPSSLLAAVHMARQLVASV